MTVEINERLKERKGEKSDTSKRKREKALGFT
jgi:hypothetical protein